MRRIIVVTAILCLCLPPLCPAETETPQIRVFGEYRTSVAPDHAVMRIVIRNKAARVAKELHKKMLEATLQTLSEFKVKDRDIKTSGPYMAPETTSVSTIRATIRDLANLSALVQTLSKKPGTEVEKLSYGHSQLPALIQNAQTSALVNAKQTALSMAGVLDAGLGDVIFIQEQSVSRRKADKITPEIPIIKKIEVVFRLGPALKP